MSKMNRNAPKSISDKTSKNVAVRTKLEDERKEERREEQVQKVPPNVKYEILPSPTKSKSDTKEYMVIKLENGLTACLIEDKTPLNALDYEEFDSESDEGSAESDGNAESEGSVESEGSSEESCDMEADESGPGRTSGREQKLAAAALTVGVGSFSDPKDIQGLAHFLEHMVFMGSEKFPEENDFDAFLSKRGGSDNAFTDCETTTFHFECFEKHLHAALDKFSQFFISPLMKRCSMSREREAVESEFQMALPGDENHKEQLLLTLAKPDSPVNTFPWGNSVSLKDNVTDDKLYEAVHEFRKRHYSAHRMTLAIQARLPMETILSYVLECFASVPNNALQPHDFSKNVDVFDTPEFRMMYYLEPTSSTTQVTLTWSLPSLLKKYKSKPQGYISWLLGHEGKGSVIAYLRKKVWVLNMYTGNEESGEEHNSMYSWFTVTVYLTTEGLKNLFSVIEAIFSYINAIRELGPQERIFNEIKQIEEIEFAYAREESAEDIVVDLSESMQKHPSEDYLTGSEVVTEYDPQGIKLITDLLTPGKMNIMVLDKSPPKDLTYNKTEKWFGTKYAATSIPEDWLDKWQNAKPYPGLSIPPPNEYLTKDFSILEDEKDHPDYPIRLSKTELMELWYRKDEKFKLPKAYYYFNIITPLPAESSKNFCLLEFMIALLKYQLAEDAYPAYVAGLSYNFRASDGDLVIKVAGYNEKLPVLIDLLTSHLVSLSSSITEEVFNSTKKEISDSYYNRLLKPAALSRDMRLQLLVSKRHSVVNQYNTVSSVTIDDVRRFAQAFMGQLYVKALVQGNVTRETATNVLNKFVSALNYKPIPEDTYPSFRVVKVPKGETFCKILSFNENDPNSVITNYYQSGPVSIKETVVIEAIVMTLQEPLFDTLRTKEQLGYQVDISLRDSYGILGLNIKVHAQAPKNSSEHVDNRIEEFIKKATELLKNMPNEDFEEMKSGLIKTKQCVDTHLKEEVERNWNEIEDGWYKFDRLNQEIKAVERLKLSDMRNWWKEYASGKGKNFRKVSIQVAGFNTTEDVSEAKLDSKIDVKLVLKFLTDGESYGKSYVIDTECFKENLYVYPVIAKSFPSK